LTVTHTFLPPTLIYLLLGHDGLDSADLGSLRCFWYGAAPMSASRLEEAIERIGPVFAQLFGQTEAPMMISTMVPEDHFLADGSLARSRLTSAGRPTPLVTVAIMNEQGRLLPTGESGEIVVRGPLIMAGYYKDTEAPEDTARHGWHHTGDIGYLDEDNYLFIVDRAKDMIITGGFNVYSAEVEQALMAHPTVQDCAVIGLPDDKWGERVTAVVQLYPESPATDDEIRRFVRDRVGGVKAPKEVEFWPDLPRSKVGKVLKNDVRARLLDSGLSAQDRPLHDDEDQEQSADHDHRPPGAQGALEGDDRLDGAQHQHADDGADDETRSTGEQRATDDDRGDGL
jgi:fatty-acyl-CoA synthase